MRINVFCILIFCCVFFCYGNHIHFKHINVKDGLSQITVLSIYQDEVGTLWFQRRTEQIQWRQDRYLSSFAKRQRPYPQ